MMAAIAIDRHVVCMEHDFNGMTLEYFWNFLLNEYIPAYRDELSGEDILQIQKGIEEKKDHIYTCDVSTMVVAYLICGEQVWIRLSVSMIILERLQSLISLKGSRAWRGYDDVDFFECFEMFRRRMIRTMEDFIKHGNGLLNLPQESDHYEDLLKRFPCGHFDEEHTELIYQTMLFHLHMMNEDYVEKKLYGKNIYDEDYEFDSRSMEDHKRIYSVMRQNKDAFMKLFSLFYYDLWD